MDKDNLTAEIALRGVDGAEDLCRELTAETLQATLRWYDAQRNGTPNLLAWKLMKGGIEVKERRAKEQKAIFLWDENTRIQWIERYLPNLDPVLAESAIIALASEGEEITVQAIINRINGQVAIKRMGEDPLGELPPPPLPDESFAEYETRVRPIVRDIIKREAEAKAALDNQADD